MGEHGYDYVHSGDSVLRVNVKVHSCLFCFLAKKRNVVLLKLTENFHVAFCTGVYVGRHKRTMAKNLSSFTTLFMSLSPLI
jgi:hypothetical protein